MYYKAVPNFKVIMLLFLTLLKTQSKLKRKEKTIFYKPTHHLFPGTPLLGTLLVTDPWLELHFSWRDSCSSLPLTIVPSAQNLLKQEVQVLLPSSCPTTSELLWRSWLTQLYVYFDILLHKLPKMPCELFLLLLYPHQEYRLFNFCLTS